MNKLSNEVQCYDNFKKVRIMVFQGVFFIQTNTNIYSLCAVPRHYTAMNNQVKSNSIQTVQYNHAGIHNIC